jgi:putative methylase
VRRRDLEAALDAIPLLAAPRPELEQYRTPSGIAAEFLLLARDEGAIERQRVLDLGCGTGTLTLAAALLGARMATGVDLDPQAIGIAQQAAQQQGVAANTWFVVAALEDWHPQADTYDTVIMNPPFGAQKQNKHADRLFLDRAVEAVRPAGTVWFLALEKTEGFLAQQAKALEATIDRVASWDYPLVATMEHHRKEVQTVRVGAYRFAWG